MDSNTRDGSLLKRKMEQWAKEKEELERKCDWFPFGSNGSPGGGNPNRKHEAKDYDVSSHSHTVSRPVDISTSSIIRDEPDPTCPAAQLLASPDFIGVSCNMHEKKSNQEQSSVNAPLQPAAYPYPFPPYGIPMSADYWQNVSSMPFHLAYPPIPVPYHMIPPGAIPIPAPQLAPSSASPMESSGFSAETSGVSNEFTYTQKSSAELPGAMPIYPISLPITHPYSAQHRPFLSDMSSFASGRYEETQQARVDGATRSLATAIVYPMSSPVILPLDNDEIGKNVHYAHTSPIAVSADSRPRALSDRSDGSTLEEQAEERKRREKENLVKEREESEKARVEQERMDRARNSEDERHHVEEINKEQERERIQQRVLEAIKKAEREAELTRKARLHKHVLEGHPDQEKQLLGEDGHRILEQVIAFERQRQRDNEQLQQLRSPKNTSKQDCHRKTRSVSLSHEADLPGKPAQRVSSPSSYSLERSRPGRASMRVVSTQKSVPVTHRSHSSERTGCAPSRIPRAVPVQRQLRDPAYSKPTVHTASHSHNQETSLHLVDYSAPPALHHSGEASYSSEERLMMMSAPDGMADSIPLRNSARPPPGPWSNIAARKPNDIVYHSANIRQLSDQPFSSTVPSASRSPLRRQSSAEAQALLFTYTPIRRGKMRFSAEEREGSLPTEAFRGSVDSNDASSSGSVSPGSRPQSHKSPSVPSINVHDSDAENKGSNNNNDDMLQYASLTQTPIAHLGRPRTVANTPVFHKRLGELGALKNVDSSDSMSPEQRRLAEARFPSMERLRASMQNLSTTDSDISHDRAISPLLDRFKSRAPQYRSFNLKRTTEKQTVVLEKLGALRDRLREKDNFQERSGFSSTRVGSFSSLRHSGH